MRFHGGHQEPVDRREGRYWDARRSHGRQWPRAPRAPAALAKTSPGSRFSCFSALAPSRSGSFSPRVPTPCRLRGAGTVGKCSPEPGEGFRRLPHTNYNSQAAPLLSGFSSPTLVAPLALVFLKPQPLSTDCGFCVLRTPAVGCAKVLD